MSQYTGEEQHGYWWLHLNGTLQYQGTNCHGVDPKEFFNNWHVAGWWYVGCQFEWYRMLKESNNLRETGNKIIA